MKTSLHIQSKKPLIKTISVLLTLVLSFNLLLLYDSPTLNPAHASHNKAIVVIPGIGGTTLENATGDTVWFSTLPFYLNQMQCTQNGSSVNVIHTSSEHFPLLEIGCIPLWISLYDSFSSDYDVLLFRYDWRLSCANAATQLEAFVQDYTEVIFVAHSMGGLVASKFLATSSANRAKVSKVITIGTPYMGSVKGLFVMESGDFTPFLPLPAQKETVKNLVKNFPAVYELLPTSRYLNCHPSYIKTYYGLFGMGTHTSSWNFMKSRAWGKNGSTPKVMFSQAESFHDSLNVNGSHIANGHLTEFHMIIGFGTDTPSTVVYRGGTSSSILKYKYNNNGDGTVSTASAVNNRGSNTVLHVRESHALLISNSSVINEVIGIINGTSSSIPSTSSMNLPAAPDGNAFIMEEGGDPEPASNDIEVNEKGWVTGEDNDRTEVIIYSGDLARLKTQNGNLIDIDGDMLYYIDEDNERVICGTVWDLGDNSKQYVFFNQGISFCAAPALLFSNDYDLEISYMSDGYYTKSVSYSSTGQILSVTVSSNTTRTISAEDPNGNPVPYVELSDLELIEMNA